MQSIKPQIEQLESRQMFSVSASDPVIAADLAAIANDRALYVSDHHDISALLASDRAAFVDAVRQRVVDSLTLRQKYIDDRAAGETQLSADVASLRSIVAGDKAAIASVRASAHAHAHDPTLLAADLAQYASSLAAYVSDVKSGRATILQHRSAHASLLQGDVQAYRKFLATDSPAMVAARQKYSDDYSAGVTKLADDRTQIHDDTVKLRSDLLNPPVSVPAPTPTPTPSPTPTPAPALHLLFYGASFVNGYQVGKGNVIPVPDLISEIAVAAGFAAPVILNNAVDSRDLSYALAHFSASAVSGSTDYVIMQEFSTRPTDIPGVGNPAGFDADALALYEKVKAIAPNAVPVLYEAWARSPQNTKDLPKYYPSLAQGSTPYTAATIEMQAELKKYNEQAAAFINSNDSTADTRVAYVGDAFEDAGWTGLYDKDNYHATNKGYLLSALVNFETIYHEKATGLNLAAVFSKHGISQADGLAIEQLADSVS